MLFEDSNCGGGGGGERKKGQSFEVFYCVDCPTFGNLPGTLKGGENKGNGREKKLIG